MTKPKIGLSMLHCLGEPFKKMTERIMRAETTTIEIVDDGFHELTKQRVSRLREIGKSRGIEYSVHAPFSDVNIASPSKFLLRAMLKRMEKSIAYAQALDAYLWVFHPGLKTGISMFYPQKDWSQNLETTKTLLKLAEEYQLKIAIENVPEPYPFLIKSVDDFVRFYAEINEEISIVLDVGHANINGQIELFWKTFKNRIAHMHLSDNDGKSDQHLGIGRGIIQWRKVADMMQEMPYDKTIVVESVEHVEESLHKLKRLFA
jgi:sugar phosphate isomerase/epimerase